MAVIVGTRRDDELAGTERSDLIVGRGGDDVIDAAGGNDRVISGKGDDTVDAGSGHDVVRTGAGDDVADGGAGSDALDLGHGDDTAVYVVAENVDDHDYYDGGRGQDTLRLEMTEAEWLEPAFQADLANLLEFLQRDGGRWFFCGPSVFAFDSLGLVIRDFEKLEIIVDGVPVDPADEAVVANDVSFTTSENAVSFGNVLSNDDVPDLVASVDLVSDVTAGSLTFNSDGTFSYDPGTAFDALAEGDTATQTFVYRVTDADGDADTATVTLTIDGENDVATIGGEVSGEVVEDGTLIVSGALTVADVDAGEAEVQPQTLTSGDYGAFSVDAAGVWTYELDNANTDVQALDSGETLTDSFLVTSVDGTASETVTVTINGTDDPGGGMPMPITTPIVIRGIDEYDLSGGSVASAGDVDGDGLDDVIIGADNAASGNGEAYLIFGSALVAAGGDDGVIELDEIVANGEGVLITGANAFDNAGSAVSSAGDVDGDGLDDVIIGAATAEIGGVLNAGAAHLVFGSTLVGAAATSGTLDLGGLAAGEGVRLTGVDYNGNAGDAVSSAGDVDGDGFDDIIVGAPQADPPSGPNAGTSFVVFASALQAAAVGSGEIDLGTIGGANGVVITGADRIDFSGGSVSSAGDVDGDGLDDIIIGAFQGETGGLSNSGDGYVVLGASIAAASSGSGTIDLGSLAGLGVAITGADVADRAGRSVSGAGDVDGDGLDDVIVGANAADPDGEASAGEAYIVFGSALTAAVAASSNIDLGSLGTQGVLIKGVDAFDSAGYSVSAAGDVDGDGLADVIVGAESADGGGLNSSGEAYVVFGSAIAAAAVGSGEIDLDGLSPSDGIVIYGASASDQFGGPVAAAGDVDGDGLDDIIVGARTAEPDGVEGAGESYVISGAVLSDEVFDDGIIDLAEYFLA